MSIACINVNSASRRSLALHPSIRSRIKPSDKCSNSHGLLLSLSHNSQYFLSLISSKEDMPNISQVLSRFTILLEFCFQYINFLPIICHNIKSIVHTLCVGTGYMQECRNLHFLRLLVSI
jgi:hypothetical protein